MKYDVFLTNNGPLVKVVAGLSDVDAIQFALNLHRSMNVPHTIFVKDNSGEAKFILTLEMK